MYGFIVHSELPLDTHVLPLETTSRLMKSYEKNYESCFLPAWEFKTLSLSVVSSRLYEQHGLKKTKTKKERHTQNERVQREGGSLER